MKVGEELSNPLTHTGAHSSEETDQPIGLWERWGEERTEGMA